MADAEAPADVEAVAEPERLRDAGADAVALAERVPAENVADADAEPVVGTADTVGYSVNRGPVVVPVAEGVGNSVILGPLAVLAADAVRLPVPDGDAVALAEPVRLVDPDADADREQGREAFI